MHTDDDHKHPLDPAFDALRAGMATLDAPRGVEKEVMAAFARQFAPRRWYQRLSTAQWGVGGTAALALLAFTLSLQSPTARPDGKVPASADHGPFIALASAERIAQESDPLMLETEVPRAELASLGVPITPENAGDSVRAELLVGADGSPLALRLIALQ